MLKPKNYGDRNREPIVLISEDQRRRMARLSGPVYIRAELVVTRRIVGKSYLTITGTNHRVIRMYDNIQNVELAKSIIEEYTEFVISEEKSGNIISCSVNIVRNLNYGGTIGTPELTALLESPSITAPEFSINLRTIRNEDDTTGITICDSYDSVFKINLIIKII